MTEVPKRRRGLRILARDAEYVRAPAAGLGADPAPEAIPRSFTESWAPSDPESTAAWQAFRRLDLRLPIEPELLHSAHMLAHRAGLPAAAVIAVARRRAVARFRAALAENAGIDTRPAPRSPARLRLTASFSEAAARTIGRRFDPLATGRSHGLVAPLASLLAEELDHVLQRAARIGAGEEWGSVGDGSASERAS